MSHFLRTLPLIFTPSGLYPATFALTGFARHFALAIHQNGSFGGRTPIPKGDRPYQRPDPRIVPPFHKGPATYEAVIVAGDSF